MQTRKIKNSPKGNGKDTENKLHQMLYGYLAITVGVVIERAHRVKKSNTNLSKFLVQLLQSYLITKTKSTHYIVARMSGTPCSKQSGKTRPV